MTDRVVIDVGGKTITRAPLPPAEQAELDALQASITTAKQADETARAAIVYGPDAIDVSDLTVIKNYVQASRDYLALPTKTNADVVAQVNRNTRAILAILRKLI